MRQIFSILLVLGISGVVLSSVKPNFELTGMKRPAGDPRHVRVIMQFPDDPHSYDVIGSMGDCSSFSEYSEFIEVYKQTAAQNGANCIVVEKTYDGGLCVEATAIFLKPKRTEGESKMMECVDRLFLLQSKLDSLNEELRRCKNKGQ
jgi:hypothetical protein